MFSGNKACISTVVFYWEFLSAFRNVLSTPEALCGVRPHPCSFTLETEAPKCLVRVLKPAVSQQGRAWPPPSAAHPLLCVMLSQCHCHLSTCRNVSVLSSTLKHGIPSYTTGVSLELSPFPEDIYQHTYKEQASHRDFYKRKGSWYLLIQKIIKCIYYT